MALHAQRILIIRPSALGDVARSVPVLVSLRRALPQARIDWLVQDTFAPVIASHPALTNVVAFPRKAFGRWVKTLNVPALVRYTRPLREAKYDLVLDCQGLARSALLGWCTRSRRRVGHKQARELAPLLYTQRVDSPIERHSVDRMLDLVDSVGVQADRSQDALRLYAPESARNWWAADPASDRDRTGRYVVLAPTSRWISKQWPADRFAALADSLAARGLNVVLVGGSNERDQIEPLLALATRNPRVIDRVGQTDIPKLMAILERAALVVANDSAALHIAVGFARPIVALYGPTRVHRVGPYGRDADVLQHATAADRLEHKDASTRALMDRISVDEVVRACEARLPTSPSATPARS